MFYLYSKIWLLLFTSRVNFITKIHWCTPDLIHTHPNSYPYFIYAIIHGYRCVFFNLMCSSLFFQVAIKYIKKSKIQDRHDLNRIRREIKIMSTLQHPNVVSVHEGMRLLYVMNSYNPGHENSHISTWLTHYRVW